MMRWFDDTRVRIALALLLAGCGGGETTTPDGGTNTQACASSLSRCGGACVDTDVDPAHCGGCEQACAAGEICAQGSCSLQCGGGTTKCGDACADTAHDPAHCGACDHACGSSQLCDQGTCVGDGSCDDDADCAAIPTASCMMVVCNLGQAAGSLHACTVVPALAGTPCDDQLFCTVNDTCDGAGTCAGHAANDCGLTVPECLKITCDEQLEACIVGAADGGDCTPASLCDAFGTCAGGTCVGTPKDCSYSALSECNAMACNPSTGACEATPDPTLDGTTCVLTGDVCHVHRVCTHGVCGGGTPKDCSSLAVGCHVGECDATSGACVQQTIPAGGACTSGVGPCQVGACDGTGACVASQAPNGTACDDGNACTTGDTCTNGACGGTPTAGCTVYLSEGFEACPAGWTLAGDWQCGAPTKVGPSAAHTGHNVLATQLAADYSANLAYATCTADSPVVSLASAVSPTLSFWVWNQTEGVSYDGHNLKISTDGGTTWALVTGVTPAYNLTVGGESAWGGRQSDLGWQRYFADLGAHAGQSIRLRFAVHSDAVQQYAGVYLDDVVLGEPSAIPLAITTTSILDAAVAAPYSAGLARIGGSSAAQWTLVGGTNASWMTINPVTGALSGTPPTGSVGPASITVQLQEPSAPGNVAQKTFAFDVVNALYTQDFEACPGGWTLTGDWQCGTPTSVGPSTAFSGTQCLATQIAANYNSSQAWATTTATSPDISLAGAAHPQLTFWVWHDTEPAFDGYNLKVSADGGASWTLVPSVTPAYDLTVGGETAWSGHQASWQPVTANLAAFAGQTIRLRFAFRSDGSAVYPGVYIDRILVSDH